LSQTAAPDTIAAPRWLCRLRFVWRVTLVLMLALTIFPAQWISWKLGLPLRRQLPMLFHRGVARIIGLRIHVCGAFTTTRPMLVLSNHVSWLDIIALGTLQPLSFVAKSEIESWPFFGLMAKLQRSIFIARERGSATAAASAAIAERLAEGDPIVLFAESTTSDGNRILPFRSALVGAARGAIAAGSAEDVAIQPVALAYHAVSGLPAGRMERSSIGWYGDMEMLPHLKIVLSGGGIDVDVCIGDVIAATSSDDRKAITKQAEDAVRVMLADGLRRRPAPIVPAETPDAP
jgi:lyso-ornithine lipid O-acyltransferase